MGGAQACADAALDEHSIVDDDEIVCLDLAGIVEAVNNRIAPLRQSHFGALLRQSEVTSRHLPSLFTSCALFAQGAPIYRLRTARLPAKGNA